MSTIVSDETLEEELLRLLLEIEKQDSKVSPAVKARKKDLPN